MDNNFTNANGKTNRDQAFSCGAASIMVNSPAEATSVEKVWNAIKTVSATWNAANEVRYNTHPVLKRNTDKSQALAHTI